MAVQWEYQVRINLADEFAELARRNPSHPALKPLSDVLNRHRASLKCQYDAFADYVSEAEERGADRYPLYQWTKATIENPAKKEKYLKSFTLHVDGRELYPRDTADALEADLKRLAGGELITRIAKHDTNPANNPQPPEQFRQAKS